MQERIQKDAEVRQLQVREALHFATCVQQAQSRTVCHSGHKQISTTNE